MKRCIILVLAAVLLCSCMLAGCGKTVTESSIAGKTYVWEKEGFGGDFTVTLKEDGTYQYYAGGLSSYIGQGKWTLGDGVVTMTEDKEICGYDNVFRFAAKDGELDYIADGSDQFMYVTVEDGDRFVYSKDADPFYLR